MIILSILLFKNFSTLGPFLKRSGQRCKMACKLPLKCHFEMFLIRINDPNLVWLMISTFLKFHENPFSISDKFNKHHSRHIRLCQPTFISTDYKLKMLQWKNQVFMISTPLQHSLQLPLAPRNINLMVSSSMSQFSTSSVIIKYFFVW